MISRKQIEVKGQDQPKIKRSGGLLEVHLIRGIGRTFAFAIRRPPLTKYAQTKGSWETETS